ncbi:MAG: cobalt transport protein CbiN [Methanomicrobiales archaeon]|nr:cobalt transport protein CbiN [Methanomicrobiales archaeon]
MLSRYRLEILAIIAIVAFCALFGYTSSRMNNAQFAGSDTVASEQISKMTGLPQEQFRPPVWQWVPPSPEVESGLFALQAAIGGICVGWVFGYWKGLQKQLERERT